MQFRDERRAPELDEIVSGRQVTRSLASALVRVCKFGARRATALPVCSFYNARSCSLVVVVVVALSLELAQRGLAAQK